jgi:hypothetical protein
VLVLGAFVAYVACGWIARRSPFYGGGTKVLSWIGFLFPCIGWIAMVQGFLALRRATTETPSPAAAANVNSYTLWAVIYVACLALAGGLYGRI